MCVASVSQFSDFLQRGTAASATLSSDEARSSWTVPAMRHHRGRDDRTIGLRRWWILWLNNASIWSLRSHGYSLRPQASKLVAAAQRLNPRAQGTQLKVSTMTTRMRACALG